MAESRRASNDLIGLAAAHAALNPERHEWRSDILISSLIEILASHGRPLNERELHLRVTNLWLTDKVDREMLRGALARAQAANLVESRKDSGDIRWSATPAAASDAKDDRKWAEAIVARFEQDVGTRLDDLLEGKVVLDRGRVHNLTRHLMTGLISASHRVFDGVVRTGDPLRLDGVYFHQSVVDNHLRAHIQPENVATALIALSRVAVDQTDEFGSEILHLIVTAQVLQGVLARRDLAGPPLVKDSLLLLDTSALVYRLEAAPQPQLLEEFFQVSKEADCEVVVTRAVIDEWASLWRSADKAARTVMNSATGLPEGSGHQLDNPVLRCWLRKAEDGRPQPWDRFRREKERIEKWLTEGRAQIIEEYDTDCRFVEQIIQELKRLSDEARTHRSLTKARRDAYSAAFIAKRREQQTAAVPRAWFIAKDPLTNKAYATLRAEDPFPIGATVEAWLLLLSRTRTHDPAQTRNLAELVSGSVILNSFLAVSASYVVEDLISICELFKEGSVSDPDELTDAIRTDYLTLASSAATDVPADLLRRRAIRRSRQAERKAEQVDADNQRENDARIEKAKEEGDRDELDRADRFVAAYQRWRRGYFLSAVLVVIAAGIATSALVGVAIWVVITAIALWAAIGLEGIKWLRDPMSNAWRFILVLATAIVWTVLGSILSVALSQPRAHNPSRDPVPVQTPIVHSSSKTSSGAAVIAKNLLYEGLSRLI